MADKDDDDDECYQALKINVHLMGHLKSSFYSQFAINQKDVVNSNVIRPDTKVFSPIPRMCFTINSY